MIDGRSSVAAMLGARSVAVVGASPRVGGFGDRMVTEVLRSPGLERVHLVNPRHAEIRGLACLPGLAAVEEPVDLVLLGVPDAQLPEQLALAAKTGAGAAVIYGNAHGNELRETLRGIATDAGLALCGAGCMGFVNAEAGIRALGYLERDPLPAGNTALITHSGSVFSTLLRARRGFGFSLAVSSGQELVTGTADYLEYALEQTSSRAVVLVLETVRDGGRLRAGLRAAAERDVPVLLLPVGLSGLGSAMVAAHSGALAGNGAMWEALCADTGALRVHDLAELADTLELLATGRRARRTGSGIATVHDSGAERALVADLASALSVPFAVPGPATRHRLAELLDDGLAATNPLDVWGTGADTRALFAGCLRAMADDPATSAVALAVDLVPEYDGDTSYPDAVLDVAGSTDIPVAVLAGLPASIDQDAAARLRAAGVAVLEGHRSGLVALRNLLALNGSRPADAAPPIDEVRRDRWLARLRDGSPWTGAESFALLADYGVPTVPVLAVSDEEQAVYAAAELGLSAGQVPGPAVVLKTDEPGIAHKSDVGGVLLDVRDPAGVRAGYAQLAATFGPRVLVCATGPVGVELALGIVADPHLGPLVVLGAGGRLVELLADRVVACPPIARSELAGLLGSLRIAPLLNGFRGLAADVDALADAVLGVSAMAVELGAALAALDLNPVIAGPGGALAVDVLVEPVLVEPVLVEPVLVEPVLVEPVLVEPVLVEPVLVEPVGPRPAQKMA